MTSFLKTRELSTLFILVAEIAFFAWYLWPEGGGRHPFFNAENGLLILKYSAIYGIAAIGASMVIISGGVDLAPGAVIALTTVILGHQYLEAGWSLPASIVAGLGVGALAGAVSAVLVVLVRLPPFIATLGVMGITRGLAYIVEHGGAGYFPIRMAKPYLEANQVHIVTKAPDFQQRIYLVYDSDRKDERFNTALQGFRFIAVRENEA